MPGEIRQFYNQYRLRKEEKSNSDLPTQTDGILTNTRKHIHGMVTWRICLATIQVANMWGDTLGNATCLTMV